MIDGVAAPNGRRGRQQPSCESVNTAEASRYE
jgi:hypothetical protein